MEMGCLKGKTYSLVGPRGYWPGRDLYKWMSDQDFQWFTMLDVEELGIDYIAKEIAEGHGGVCQCDIIVRFG